MPDEVPHIKNDSLVNFIQLKHVMPSAQEKKLSLFEEVFNQILPMYAITTPRRLSAFIAQGAHESGELHELVENMNYSSPPIVEVWPSRFKSIAMAEPYAHQPEKLGNYVYANRMGNGSPETGDGYKFRGRGWFNGTGKEFYQKMMHITGIDFISNPDLLAQPTPAVKSACIEWKLYELNALSDAENFKEITYKINGGYIGLKDRLAYYKKAKEAFGA